jgi:hypothetical protein
VISVSVAAVVVVKLPRVVSNISLYGIFHGHGYGFENIVRCKDGTYDRIGDRIALVGVQFAFCHCDDRSLFSTTFMVRAKT